VLPIGLFTEATSLHLLHIGRRLLVPTAHLLDLLGLADKGQVKVDTRLLEALSEPQPA
jgi:hypothetical protein